MIDPGLKESILGDLRIANALISAGKPMLGLQVLGIAVERTKRAYGRASR